MYYVKREPFTEKKKIVFLFSGNARSSPFTIETKHRNREILECYNQRIFTEEFKEKYDYDVYITTDNIHLQDTIEYFSKNHIKNIHLLDHDYYLTTNKDTSSTSNQKKVEYYLNKYNEKDWSYFQKHEGSIHQHYKILDCYNLSKKDGSFDNADFIVRIRMDVVINKNIQELINVIEKNPDVEIVIDWDIFALGKPSIMKWYCTGLERDYGNYNFNVPVPETFPVMDDYLTTNKKKWTYSAERQLFEMLYDYCHKKKLDINKAIVNIKMCDIKRIDT
jgi:hypothetical protein